MDKLRKRQRFWGYLSLSLIVVILLLSLRSNSIAVDMKNKLASPSLSHLFGTDYMGRDLFSLSIEGFRNSFILALLSQLPPFFFGAVLGAYLGFYKGILDEIMLYVFNVLLSFPILLAAIFLSLFWGKGLWTMFVVIALFSTIYNAKIVRAEIGQVSNEDYIMALRINGIPNRRIFWYHVFPRSCYTLFPLIPILIGHSMISISSYSFLGLGLEISTPEIGIILKDGLRFADGAPWLIIFPGSLQFLIVMVFSFYSDSLEAYFQKGGRWS